MNEYISLNHYLILSSLVFTIGMFGLFMHRKNIINILMSIELMLLAVNINFVAFPYICKNYQDKFLAL